MEKYYPDNSLFSIEEHSGYSSALGNHFHSFLELYYLEQGQITYFIESSVYSIKEGDVVIIPPSTMHKTVDICSAKRKRILIYLDKNLVNGLCDLDLSLWNNVSVISTNKTTKIGELFHELLYEYKNENNPQLIRALTVQLIITLERKLKTNDKLIEESVCSKRISEVVAYVNQNYASDITLNSTADHFYLSHSYLSRLFKEETGISFCDYLRKYRIKMAIEAMSVKNSNITKIAFDSGFNSTNHFCKTFKAVMNMSPLQYKKHYINKN